MRSNKVRVLRRAMSWDDPAPWKLIVPRLNGTADLLGFQSWGQAIDAAFWYARRA